MISVSRAHAIPLLLLSVAFPFVLILGVLNYGLIAAIAAIVLLLLVGGLYQHYVVPLVVRVTPESE